MPVIQRFYCSFFTSHIPDINKARTFWWKWSPMNSSVQLLKEILWKFCLQTWKGNLTFRTSHLGWTMNSFFKVKCHRSFQQRLSQQLQQFIQYSWNCQGKTDDNMAKFAIQFVSVLFIFIYFLIKSDSCRTGLLSVSQMNTLNSDAPLPFLFCWLKKEKRFPLLFPPPSASCNVYFKLICFYCPKACLVLQITFRPKPESVLNHLMCDCNWLQFLQNLVAELDLWEHRVSAQEPHPCSLYLAAWMQKVARQNPEQKHHLVILHSNKSNQTNCHCQSASPRHLFYLPSAYQGQWQQLKFLKTAVSHWLNTKSAIFLHVVYTLQICYIKVYLISFTFKRSVSNSQGISKYRGKRSTSIAKYHLLFGPV